MPQESLLSELDLELPELDSENPFPALSQESLSALYAMGYELYRNGKFDDAKCFFRFLTLNNSFERKYWMGLGACFQMLKKYTDAIECYSAAALQDSTEPFVHMHAADCYFHMGNLAQARTALDAAIYIATESPEYASLLPKLTIVSEIWSKLKQGGSHA